MQQQDISHNIWDTVGIVCLVNIICFGSFYLSSVYLTEVVLLGASMDTATAFSVGHFSRPLGALLFGLRADLRGIERTMRESIFLLLISTAAMGLLTEPISGSILCAVLRAFQGLGLGGSYACMAVLLFNLAPSSKKGHVTGLLQSSVPIGYLTALLLSILIRSIFPNPHLDHAPWKYSFFLPLIAYFFIYRLRFHHPKPEAASLSGRDYWNQIIYVAKYVRGHWQTFGGAAFFAISAGTLAFTVANFKFYFMKVILKMDPVVVDFSAAITTVFVLPFYIIGGWLLDHRNMRSLNFSFIILGTLLTIPAFQFIELMAIKNQGTTFHHRWMNSSTIEIIMVLISITAVTAIPFGSLVAFICRQFPQRVRCFLFASTYSLGAGLSGGLTHLYGAFTFHRSADKYHGLYLGVAICLSTVLLSFLFYYVRSEKEDDETGL